MVEIEYVHGTYVGEVNNKKPEDRSGSFYWKNDKKLKEYHGSFNAGQFHGYGKLYFQDGFIQEGIFAYGRYIGIVEKWDEKTGLCIPLSSIDEYPEGKVKISRQSQNHHFDYYEGDWYKGFRHGYGVRKNDSDYTEQKGFFFNNKFIATEFTDNAGKNVRLTNGNYSGKVCISYPDGSIYKGYWNNGYRDGYGEYSYCNGDWYKGYWKMGLRQTSENSTSTYYSKDLDSEYTGSFNNDKIEGPGRIKSCSNMNIFKGLFKNGKKDGEGIQYYQNIGHCEGNWNEGIQSGQQFYSFEEIEGVDTEITANYSNNLPISCQFKSKKYSLNADKISLNENYALNFDIDSTVCDNRGFGAFLESILKIFSTGIFGSISRKTIEIIQQLAIKNNTPISKDLIDLLCPKVNEKNKTKETLTNKPKGTFVGAFFYPIFTPNPSDFSVHVSAIPDFHLASSHTERYSTSVSSWHVTCYMDPSKECSYLYWD